MINSKMHDFKTHHLFMDRLNDIYRAENLLIEVLPKMIEAADSKELQETFIEHLMITENHIVQLKKIFHLLKEKVENGKCQVMQEIVEEGIYLVAKIKKDRLVRDDSLILTCQKAKYYEITIYKRLLALSEMMQKDKVHGLLLQNLEEEQIADYLLRKLALDDVSESAVG